MISLYRAVGESYDKAFPEAFVSRPSNVFYSSISYLVCITITPTENPSLPLAHIMGELGPVIGVVRTGTRPAEEIKGSGLYGRRNTALFQLPTIFLINTSYPDRDVTVCGDRRQRCQYLPRRHADHDIECARAVNHTPRNRNDLVINWRTRLYKGWCEEESMCRVLRED